MHFRNLANYFEAISFANPFWAVWCGGPTVFAESTKSKNSAVLLLSEEGLTDGITKPVFARARCEAKQILG
jgi:hypothetical protein